MARFEVPEGWVAQAYRFALDPTPAQVSMLESHCGAARFVFNHMLGVVKANLDQRSAERSYGIAEQDLTPAQGWSLAKLRKTWNARKNEVAPWWQANSKEAYNSGLDGLARALENWSTSRSGERAGAAVGFPRLKARHRSARSVRFTTGAIRVEPDRHHVTLPRIGRIRTHESTRKLAAPPAGGDGADPVGHGEFHRRALGVRVSGDRGRQDPARPRPPIAAPGGGCGCRGQGSAGGRHRRRRGGGSDRGAETVDPGAVAAAGGPTAGGAPVWPLRSRHEDAAGAVETVGSAPMPGWGGFMRRWPRSGRSEIHQATTDLATRHDGRRVEQLAAKNMGRRGGRRKRGLNRALGDAALGRIRTQLGYKTSWYGTTLVTAPGFFRPLNCVHAAGRKPNSGCATASTTAATDARQLIGI